MIAVIDYDTGNLRSVENALKRAGGEFIVTADAAAIRSADRVLLPGVGEASTAMARLREKGLDKVIPSLTQPVLGICIGMQLMCGSSREGETECLGIFGTEVVKLEAVPGIKVPHMGWNTVAGLRTPLFKNIGENTYFYFVHSYAPLICKETSAMSSHGREFSSALSRDNFYGTQFHPEKSGSAGEKVLRNFLEL